jgi:hypothetical protein
VSETRLDGVVQFWKEVDATRAYGHIACDGRIFHCNALAIRPDNLFRRYLVEGEPVSFIPCAERPGRRPQADDVERKWAEVGDIESHREVCIVLNDKFLLRRFGGWLFIPQATKRRLNLKPEMVVECGIIAPEFGRNAVARQIEVLANSEDQWLAYEAQKAALKQTY